MSRPIVLIALVFGAGAAAGSVAAQDYVGDRYGSATSARLAQAYQPMEPAHLGRVLTWPGKAGVSHPPVSTPVSQSYAPVVAGVARTPWPVSVAAPSSLAGPPTQAWRPVFSASPPPVAARQPATSTYAARPGPPPQGQPAARRYAYDPTQDHSVRFYSVHRPFGLNPDPAPIPPQFFTATADLSDPPGPTPVNRVTPVARAASFGGSDGGGQ